MIYRKRREPVAPSAEEKELDSIADRIIDSALKGKELLNFSYGGGGALENLLERAKGRLPRIR